MFGGGWFNEKKINIQGKELPFSWTSLWYGILIVLMIIALAYIIYNYFYSDNKEKHTTGLLVSGLSLGFISGLLLQHTFDVKRAKNSDNMSKI